MSTPQPVDSRPSRAPTEAEFCPPPASIRHFEMGRFREPIDMLDHLVTEMVARRVPIRNLAICGPIACGKRALARAVAREFGGDYLELEHTSLECQQSTRDIIALLARLRDRPLVLHNFERFPDAAHLAVRAVLEARMHWRECTITEELRAEMQAADDAQVGISDFPVIATMSACDKLLASRLGQFQSFFLHRSAQGSAAALMRTLRMHGIECSSEGAEVLGEFLVSTESDMYAGMCALVVAHARHNGLTAIDGPTARRIREVAWSFMPPRSLVDSLEALARRDGMDPDEVANRLSVPQDVFVYAGVLMRDE